MLSFARATAPKLPSENSQWGGKGRLSEVPGLSPLALKQIAKCLCSLVEQGSSKSREELYTSPFATPRKWQTRFWLVLRGNDRYKSHLLPAWSPELTPQATAAMQTLFLQLSKPCKTPSATPTLKASYKVQVKENFWQAQLFFTTWLHSVGETGTVNRKYLY